MIDFGILFFLDVYFKIGWKMILYFGIVILFIFWDISIDFGLIKLKFVVLRFYELFMVGKD